MMPIIAFLIISKAPKIKIDDCNIKHLCDDYVALIMLSPAETSVT